MCVAFPRWLPPPSYVARALASVPAFISTTLVWANPFSFHLKLIIFVHSSLLCCTQANLALNWLAHYSSLPPSSSTQHSGTLNILCMSFLNDSYNSSQNVHFTFVFVAYHANKAYLGGTASLCWHRGNPLCSRHITKIDFSGELSVSCSSSLSSTVTAPVPYSSAAHFCKESESTLVPVIISRQRECILCNQCTVHSFVCLVYCSIAFLFVSKGRTHFLI